MQTEYPQETETAADNFEKEADHGVTSETAADAINTDYILVKAETFERTNHGDGPRGFCFAGGASRGRTSWVLRAEQDFLCRKPVGSDA